jgi:glucose-6-phosphate 1-dehydrogenase
MRTGTPAESCIIVIFGATGDLTRRELLPSLFELFRKDLLPDQFAIIGAGRDDRSDADFRDAMRGAVKQHCAGSVAQWHDFAQRVHYARVDASAPAEADYTALADAIQRTRDEHGIADNVLFHLAVPPTLFSVIARRLGDAGLSRAQNGWRRLIIEKPFGIDRASAATLDRELREVFGEEQIYRVDHFLGKETVQNMLVFRFGNPGFEPIWNRNYIDHVQITVAEDIGIGTRASFYEQTGVVRDMIQNHLLQLLCMIAMEPPIRFDAKSLRDETAKVLDAVTIGDLQNDAMRGQYAAGIIGKEQVRAYREEDGVNRESRTATYAALKLTLDNWRWAGVPFYLRTGKRMTRGLQEIALQFKPTPHMMFALAGEQESAGRVLVFEVKPDEGIVQTLVAKQPGPDLVVRTVTMDFRYADAFGVEEPPRAYAWLILDAMVGDQTLFARADWIDRAWQIVDPVIARWENEAPADFPNYAAGTAGPAAADELLARDGRRWRTLEAPIGTNKR